MGVVLKEKDVYCFKAKLKHVDDDECFIVPFNVVAEDRHKAQTILKKWLETPAQTGFRYECCVGITNEPCSSVIVEEEKEQC